MKKKLLSICMVTCMAFQVVACGAADAASAASLPALFAPDLGDGVMGLLHEKISVDTELSDRYTSN